jgi:spore coat protein U-like protein
MRKGYLVMIVMIIALLMAGGLWAAEVSTTMNVLAVNPASQAATVSATDLNFGTLSLTGPTNAEATITVNAPNGTPYQIGIDGGLNLYNCSNSRCMTGLDQYNIVSYQVLYELYTDAARTTVWGDSCTSSPTYGTYSCAGPFTGTGADQTYTVYGQAQQALDLTEVVDLDDTVTITVVY